MRKDVYIKLTGDYSGLIQLDETQAVPVEKAVTDAAKPESKKGGKTYPFKVKGTKENRIVIDSLPKEKSISCELIEDGCAVLAPAVMRIMSTEEKSNNSNDFQEIEYSVTIRDMIAELFATVGDSEMQELNVSEWDHTYNAANVIASFNHTDSDGYKYLLPYGTSNKYNLTEFRPALYARPLMKKIFAQHGFSYEWATEDDENTQFGKWVIPYNGDVPKQTKEFIDGLTVEAEKTVTQSLTGLGSAGVPAQVPQLQVTITNEITDASSSYNDTTSVYSSPIYYLGGGNISFSLVVEWELVLNNSTGSAAYLVADSPLLNFGATFTPKMYLGKNGGVANAGVYFLNQANPFINIQGGTTLATGETVIGSGTTDVSFAAGITTNSSTYRVFAGATVSPSSMKWRNTNMVTGALVNVDTILRVKTVKMLISPSMSEIGFNQQISMNDFLPKKMKQAEFLKSIFTLENIIATPDKFQPTKIILRKRDEFYDSGIVVKDFEKLIDKKRGKNREFLSLSTNKRIIWSYKDDSDEANKLYKESTNEVYGQMEYIFQTEHEKGTERKEIAFSATPCTLNSHGAVVPTINGVAPKNNIRLLFDGGNYPCNDYSIVEYIDNSGNEVATVVSEYPSINHTDKPYNPSFDLLFGTPDFMFYESVTRTANNAFNRNWRRTANQIDTGEILTLWAKTHPSFVESLEMNEKYYIDGSYWYLNKLQYNASDTSVYKYEFVTAETQVSLPLFRIKKPVGGSFGDVIKNPIKEIGQAIMELSNIVLSPFKPLIFGKNNTVAASVKGAVIIGENNVVGAEKAIVIGDGFNAEEPGLYTPKIVFPDGSELKSKSDASNFFTGDQIQDDNRSHNANGKDTTITGVKNWVLDGSLNPNTLTEATLKVKGNGVTGITKLFEVGNSSGVSKFVVYGNGLIDGETYQGQYMQVSNGFRSAFFPQCRIEPGSGINYYSRGEIGSALLCHIFGTDSSVTSAGSEIFVFKNGSTILFGMDKDGKIYANGLPTSSTGLPSGYLFKSDNGDGTSTIKIIN